MSWKNANLYLEAGGGGLFDLGLLIEKQTRVPTEFYDDRSIEEDFKSNSESFKGGQTFKTYHIRIF